MHRDQLESTVVLAQRRDDQRPVDPLAREPLEGLGVDLLDLEAREDAESPLPVFNVVDHAPRELARAEGAVLAKVEAVLAREVREERLPRAPARARRDSLGAGQGHEEPVHRELAREVRVEVGAIVTAPGLGTDQDVGVQPHRRLEGSRWASPAVDARVQVERRDSHHSTLGERHGVWQSLGVEFVNVTFGHRIWWVDAFIGEAERGSPAVVVLLERQMSDDELQQIAFELGVTETAFVRRVGDGWSLRWFTPTVEVDLSGHAALATLHVLLTELGVPDGEFFFQTHAGVLTGRRLRDGLLGVDLPRAYVEPLDESVLNDCLGPVREVYQAGPQSVLAVVEDYDVLCGLAIDPMSLFLVPSAMVIAACRGGPDVDVSIRVFAPRLGLAEDHVTGSAMCSIAPWWMETVGSPTVSVYQASARGGRMYARLFEKNVEVAGMARTFFGGDLRA